MRKKTPSRPLSRARRPLDASTFDTPKRVVDSAFSTKQQQLSSRSKERTCDDALEYIFLGKIGRGFRRGFVVLQICIKERGVLWFLEEKLLGILVFIGSMILMNLLCFFAR